MPAADTAQAFGGTRAIGVRYGWSRSTVLRKIHAGDFPASKHGEGDYRIAFADVETYIAQNVVASDNGDAERWAADKMRRRMKTSE